MINYSTKQQKVILARLARNQAECVSAQQLADELRADGERIGVATVYRQLEKLERGGFVHKALTEEGAFYRYCPEQDASACFLLKCERCGRIVHADCEQLSPLYRHLEEEHHFTINPRRTMLYGLCQNCAEAPLDAG